MPASLTMSPRRGSNPGGLSSAATLDLVGVSAAKYSAKFIETYVRST
jgi:hypothetical protein